MNNRLALWVIVLSDLLISLTNDFFFLTIDATLINSFAYCQQSIIKTK